MEFPKGRDDALRAFASLVCTENRYRAIIERLLDSAAEIRAAEGRVVAGEILYLESMRALLDAAVKAFARIDDSSHPTPMFEQSTPPKLTDDFDEIAHALEDPRWKLLDEVQRTLDAAAEEARKLLEERQRTLAEIQDALDALAKAIQDAEAVKAPIRPEKDGREALQARKDDASRLGTDSRAVFEALRKDLCAVATDLKGAPRFPPIHQALSQVDAKAKRARDVLRRADLLVLRSPPVSGRYQYEALLRTASEPGVHGINLHAPSTLTKQDRLGLAATIERLGDAVARSRSASGAQPPIEQTAPSPTEAPPSAGALSRDAVLRVGGKRVEPFDEKELVDMGDFLFRLFLPEAVQRYLQDDPTCSVTITTNDLVIPWELMHDGADFLCLRRPMARMPMGTFLPRGRPIVRSSDALRFLLVWPDEGLQGARKEIADIKAALRGLAEKSYRIEITELGPDENRAEKRERATGQALNEKLRSGRFDVIHFAGHASFNAKNPDLSALLMVDREPFFAEKIRKLTKGSPFVFLNACESGATSAEAKKDPLARSSYLQLPASGLASAFIYGGALGCIGTLWEVPDDGAARLAIEIYERILEGRMIGDALLEGRNVLHQNHEIAKQLTWAAFVLYGDPTFCIRPPPKLSAPSTALAP
ncbi:MAG: CHAT domain-containing protein [Polyangiaceae bacterium]